jgi:hypothetical protein
MKAKCIFLLSFIFFQSCSVYNQVAQYDEFTDKALMNIQVKMDGFISELALKQGTSEASFEKNKSFYKEIDKDLKLLEFRAGAIPKNEISQKLIRNIRDSIFGKEELGGLMQLHSLNGTKDIGPDLKTLNIQNLQINQAVSAALQLEISKLTKK